MSIGLGKRYWVHMIKHFNGSLEECIKFMQENKPKSKYEWYELRPEVKVRKNGSYCETYSIDLVEEAK